MAKVTSKLQVSLPKALAVQYRIKPGDEVMWVASGDAIRFVPAARKPAREDAASRLRWFDAATQRQRARESTPASVAAAGAERGWTREELHRRGRVD